MAMVLEGGHISNNTNTCVVGSYTGTGSTTSNSLTFDFNPNIVIICALTYRDSEYYYERMILDKKNNKIMYQSIDFNGSTGSGSDGYTYSFSGNTFTWKFNYTYANAEYNMNLYGITYHYIAW